MSATATDIFFCSSSILSTASDPHRRTTTSRQYSSSTKKQERQSLVKNQIFNGSAVDSFLASSSVSTNIAQPSVGISRKDLPKTDSSPTKRYVSSFNTLVNSTSGKQRQRLSYVKDSVLIVKLTKENATENTNSISQVSNKHSTLSMASTPTVTTPLPKQSSPYPPSLSPMLKVEGQRRRVAHHELCLAPSANTDTLIPTNSTSSMAMSTTSHPSSNPSLFAYRNSVASGTTIRQRALAESNTNSLLITSERYKSNISSSMRPARQPLTATTTTTMPSAYIPSQQSQRNVNQNIRTRIQQEKLNNSKDLYDYPDPFTNCPQDVLSKLAQLTKLQLETIDWEKKRRFTKKKPLTNGMAQGKDSP